MKTFQADQIKNIAILGNSGSGKTTLAEAMLFNGGVIERRGTIEGKNTVSDYRPIEHENGNSIFSTVLYAEYLNKKINILDTPGLDDFSGGVISSLFAADAAVMTINVQNGVEVGTEIHFRHAEKNHKPLILAVNGLDHEKTNFEKSVEMIKERLSTSITLIQYPLNEGAGFNSIIDVLKMKMLRYAKDGGKAEIVDIPADQADRAAELHNSLVEKAAESDEALMELFFANDTLTEEEIKKGIAMGIITRGLFPVLCISAKNNIGVDRLMEFIVNEAPSISDMPAIVNSKGNEVKPNPSGSASVYVFKSSIEEHIGEINYFRVFSGKITENLDVINSINNSKERLSQLYICAGKNRTRVSELNTGDIGAFVKLKNTKTGHTLNAPGNDWKYEGIVFPEPKYRTAIKAQSESDDEKLGEALNKIHMEDPTVKIEYSKELKQIIVHGQGEYHLNIMKWHLDNIYRIPTSFNLPKIPYRETITKTAQADYRHKKQSGGAGQFGEVHMIIEPYEEGSKELAMQKIGGKDIKIAVRDKEEITLPWGGKLIYVNSIVGGSIDARFMPAILKGIMEKMEVGPLTGSYARDIRVYVYDGKMHPVDSNEISFRLAGRNAFSTAFKNAGPKILEPVYDVEIFVPSDRMGDVISDLQGRRGMVLGMASEKRFEVIKAKVPLAEMNKYSTALSSITGGRAMYTMKFAEYAPVPGDVQEAVIKAYSEEEEEE
ncbi:MAG: elongation factor G [Bacteroidetes bacterium GWE2_41_25]|nr:MAG: elongation factor G [Bacteroidetes bacterium GWA2_40_15]OFX97222.1 MAG: elongation factor G [Bacteroidetes bacterium GWC2_40_22]OFY05116.1 MAG: elongation factor G [Bacteroidetes bacterium GWE2_41_25]OFY58292.1 MAG: elongation factor G [Bacteroidetes bacterium GWF2_41_9]HAM11472.1 elongation factor G [Bacteroidales bacterium]